jgi:hypothetical protein
MIGKISALRSVISNYDVNLRFKDLHIQLPSPIEEFKVEYEPYYPFFWNYYKQGLQLAFLPTGFDEKLHCTTMLDDVNQPWAFHMWYTRQWASKMKFCGLPNFLRYQRAKHFLDTTFKTNYIKVASAVKIQNLLRILYGRFFVKNVRRLRDRARKLFL